MDEIACREEVWKGRIPLYHKGGSGEEAGPLCHLEEIIKSKRRWAGMSLTLPPGTNLYVGKKMCRAGSTCTIREELERR